MVHFAAYNFLTVLSESDNSGTIQIKINRIVGHVQHVGDHKNKYIVGMLLWAWGIFLIAVNDMANKLR